MFEYFHEPADIIIAIMFNFTFLVRVYFFPMPVRRNFIAWKQFQGGVLFYKFAAKPLEGKEFNDRSVSRIYLLRKRGIGRAWMRGEEKSRAKLEKPQKSRMKERRGGENL